jgi:hypothetical protein
VPIVANNLRTAMTVSFTGATTSDEMPVSRGYFFVKIKGGTGTVVLERYDVSQDEWDIADTFAADTAKNFYEAVGNTAYRLSCTVYTSGTIKGTIAAPAVQVPS